jgi:hypothetical protein
MDPVASQSPDAAAADNRYAVYGVFYPGQDVAPSGRDFTQTAQKIMSMSDGPAAGALDQDAMHQLYHLDRAALDPSTFDLSNVFMSSDDQNPHGKMSDNKMACMQPPDASGVPIVTWWDGDGNCNVLWVTSNNDAGTKQVRDIVMGRKRELSLSHETSVELDPNTGKPHIKFKPQHIAVLGHDDNKADRPNCTIKGVEPLHPKHNTHWRNLQKELSGHMDGFSNNIQYIEGILGALRTPKNAEPKINTDLHRYSMEPQNVVKSKQSSSIAKAQEPTSASMAAPEQKMEMAEQPPAQDQQQHQQQQPPAAQPAVPDQQEMQQEQQQQQDKVTQESVVDQLQTEFGMTEDMAKAVATKGLPQNTQDVIRIIDSVSGNDVEKKSNMMDLMSTFAATLENSRRLNEEKKELQRRLEDYEQQNNSLREKTQLSEAQAKEVADGMLEDWARSLEEVGLKGSCNLEALKELAGGDNNAERLKTMQLLNRNLIGPVVACAHRTNAYNRGQEEQQKQQQQQQTDYSALRSYPHFSSGSSSSLSSSSSSSSVTKTTPVVAQTAVPAVSSPPEKMQKRSLNLGFGGVASDTQLFESYIGQKRAHQPWWERQNRY